MDKSSSATCLLHSDVVKGTQVKSHARGLGRGRRRSREKGNQGVGDFRFINILQNLATLIFVDSAVKSQTLRFTL